MNKSVPVLSTSRVVLSSGETITISGVYSVPHFAEHKRADQVIAQRNHKVPACPQCGAGVTFELVRRVPPLTEDPDFQSEGPGLEEERGLEDDSPQNTG